MDNKQQGLLEFGAFRLDAVQRLLFSGGQQIPLTPKALETLLALVEADGRVVEKDELLKKVWPDTFVEEGSLARNISILRKVLGESPDDQKYIQTIPKRGYRFVAPVRCLTETRPVEAPAAANSVPRRPGAAVIAGSSLMIVAIVAFVVWQFGLRRENRGGFDSPIRSIAVLPLQNLSGDPKQEYFADGITDALITSLAQIRALKVISRTSVMRYKGSTKRLPDIAHELGADAILEGSVQRDGNKVRITAQLIQAASDTHMWARSYDSDLSDILHLEAELASVVAREIQVQVGADARKRLNRTPRIEAAAQDEYLLARHQQDIRDEAHLKEAIRHFEAAIQIAPDFAAAYAGLGHAWVQRGVLGDSGFRKSEAPARKAAIRAIELDPDLAEAHEALADVLMFYDLAWVTSEQEFRRAIELQPNSVGAHVYYATLLEVLGRFDEAVAEGRRSLELDPVSVTVNSEYGRVLFRARRYDESIRQYLRTLELDPEDRITRLRLVDAYLQTFRFQEALALLPTTPSQDARAYALAGRTAEARKIVDGVTNGYSRLDYALALFALKEYDRGFQSLTKAFDDRGYVNLIACDPRWDTLRGDPRFQSLIHRLGLPERADQDRRFVNR